MRDENPDLFEERTKSGTPVEVDAEVDADLSFLDELASQWEEEQQAAHERLAKSYVLAESVLGYPYKKRKREPETEEQRISRLLSEVLGGSA
jgi:hypothetical protein